MNKSIESLANDLAESLWVMAGSNDSLPASKRTFEQNEAKRASDIVSAFAGYFSEAGTTSEQDALLKSLGFMGATQPIELLKEWAEAPSTEYGRGEEDPGACIHCYALSYKPHTPTCLVERTKNLLQGVNG